MPSTSVYLPEEISARLKKYSEKADVKQSTNSIIVAALSEYLDKYESIKEWSTQFLEWGGEEEDAMPELGSGISAVRETEGFEIDRTPWREIEI
jgi:predicted transcriptional regulator